MVSNISKITWLQLTYYKDCSLSWWVECSPMVRETWVQSQIASYQRLLKWYVIPLCLTLSNIRYVSSVKWSNTGKWVALSPTPLCSSYWKGSLLVTLDYRRQLYFFTINYDNEFTLWYLWVNKNILGKYYSFKKQFLKQIIGIQLWFQVFIPNTNNLHIYDLIYFEKLYGFK